MTRGIYLGTLLICFSLLVCCSWASHQESTWSPDNAPAPLIWRSQSKGSSPQDGFRQANKVKGSSTYTGAKYEPDPLEKYLIFQTNPGGQRLYSSSGYVRPKNVGQSGGSMSHSSNQYNSVFRTWPGQQGTQRIGQYAPSKPENSPNRSSQQSSVWTPRKGKVQQKPDLNTKFNGKHGFKPPKEFMKPTSALSRGSKRRYPKKFSKHSFSRPQVNPVRSNLYHRYELPISQQLGLSQSHPVSAYNQAFHLGEGSSVHHIPLEYGGHPIKRPGDEEPVKQSLTTKKPQKPLTSKPPKIYTLRLQEAAYTLRPLQKEAYTLRPLQKEAYTLRPLQKEAYTLRPLQKEAYTLRPLQKEAYTLRPLQKEAYTLRPLQKEAYTLRPLQKEAYTARRQKPHKKSKWIQVLSYKLAGAHGVPVKTL